MAETEAHWQFKFEKVKQRCGHLFEYKLWSDCTLVVGSEKIQAHKLILAMASPVFEQMFYGGPSDRNEPTISEIQPETFKSLLQYIYTGNTDIASLPLDMAWGLLCGAKRYKLPHLVTECNRYICSGLTPRNACRGYELACLYDEQTVADECIRIITTNTKDVLNDSSFNDLELSTVITVCSLDNLNVDELELFQAVEKYAKAEQRRPGQVSPTGDGAPSEELSEVRLQPTTSKDKVLLPSAGSSSQTSPAVELHSKTTEETPSKPTANKENSKELPEGQRPSIRAAIEQIRFLSLSAKEFASGPARSGLLTKGEAFAVLMNIASAGCAEPMPTGFSQCREPRKPRSDSVDEGPVAKPRPAPSTASLGVAATKPKSADSAEIVRGLLSHDQETLEQAARAARHMTSADADGASENLTQLIAAGAIPPLVAALRHPSTGVKHDAACAISNIACVFKYTLNIEGAVPELVGLLGHDDGAVSEQAARALGNFAENDITARDAVIKAGAVPALLAHMQPSTPSAALGTYVRTYRMICTYQKGDFSDWSQPRFEQLLPAMPHLEKLLLLTDEQVLAEACWAVHYLAGIAHIKTELFASTLAERLTALLRPDASAPSVQTAALAAVGTILASGGTLVDLYLGAGCLDLIIYFLKCGNPSHVEEAARASSRILVYPHIQGALDKGILDALVPALTDGNFKCKRNAARAICTFCELSSALAIAVLAASAALKPYCRLLADGPYSVEGDTCGNVLNGLTAMLKKVEGNTKDDILLKLREICVPQLLKRLLRCENKWKRKVVKDLLQTYFSSDQ